MSRVKGTSTVSVYSLAATSTSRSAMNSKATDARLAMQLKVWILQGFKGALRERQQIAVGRALGPETGVRGSRTPADRTGRSGGSRSPSPDRASAPWPAVLRRPCPSAPRGASDRLAAESRADRGTRSSARPRPGLHADPARPARHERSRIDGLLVQQELEIDGCRRWATRQHRSA